MVKRKRSQKRPPCPLCRKPLASAQVPRIERQGERILCECGTDCWVRKAHDGSGFHVAMFRANRPLRVKVIRNEES